VSKIDNATDAEFERLVREVAVLELQLARTAEVLAALRLPTHGAEPVDLGGSAEDGMTYDEWLALGVARGFATEPFCMTHEPAPMSDTESELDSEGVDFCVQVSRLGVLEDWEVDALALAEVLIDAASGSRDR